MGCNIKNMFFNVKKIYVFIILLCAIGGTVCFIFITKNVMNKYKVQYTNDDFRRIKEIDLSKNVCSLDKKNIVDTKVHIEDSNGRMSSAYVLVVYKEKLDLYLKSKLSALVSDKLQLEEQDIYIDYIDMATYTSNE